MDIVDVGLYFSYVLIGACAIAAIVIPLIQSFSDPKSLVKSGIGVVALAALFGIGYAMADGVTSNDEVTEGAARLVGAGMITTYAFFFVAIGGIAFTEISKLFK